MTPKVDERDVIYNVFSNGSGLVSVKATHIPTGVTATVNRVPRLPEARVEAVRLLRQGIAAYVAYNLAEGHYEQDCE